MRFAVLIALLAIGACAPASAPSRDTGGPAKRLNPTEACEAEGGTYAQICLMGDWACVRRLPDAGKPCTDKAQCSGQCRFEGGTPPKDATAVGACQRTTNPCGCHASVIEGKVQPALCVD